ncbi:MAG: FtsX-like permease family protein [Bacilli bacterium]
MMLFKLSIRNIKKSIKDYAIYFFTLVLGVAIFYVFNSLDGQTAFLHFNETTSELINMIIETLGVVSVFVSIVLGFLIIYANNFLIKRRKKEFGIYLTLGMGKKQISKILTFETILIGILSLGVGLVLGVFASQFMSLIVAKLFEVNMTNFIFVFSFKALIKTIVYFGISYILVMLFNTVSISRCKLIDLLKAKNKCEKQTIKKPFISVILFIVSIIVLGVAYYLVTGDIYSFSITKLISAIILGLIGTYLFFFSLSGFIIKLVQHNKKLYYKDLNIFVLRQIDSKINTTVVSVSVICIMLFLTIGALSSALSINRATNEMLKTNNPVDLNFVVFSDENIIDILNKGKFDFDKNFKEYVSVKMYDSTIKIIDIYKNNITAFNKKFPGLSTESTLDIIGEKDYNNIAAIYGLEKVNLKENQYAVLLDTKELKSSVNEGLKNNNILNMNGKELTPVSPTCINGFVSMSDAGYGPGVIILEDEVVSSLTSQESLIAGNYHSSNKDEDEIENKKVLKNLEDAIALSGASTGYFYTSKIDVYLSSVGLKALVTFISLYLGIVFLISASAILALKELSESSDNKERYTMLRRLGADEKIIDKSLFSQSAIFFFLPLLLAIVHSIFGIWFMSLILTGLIDNNILYSIICTSVIIILIYGGYFLITYFSSRNIIKEK